MKVSPRLASRLQGMSDEQKAFVFEVAYQGTLQGVKYGFALGLAAAAVIAWAYSMWGH